MIPFVESALRRYRLVSSVLVLSHHHLLPSWPRLSRAEGRSGGSALGQKQKVMPAKKRTDAKQNEMSAKGQKGTSNYSMTSSVRESNEWPAMAMSARLPKADVDWQLRAALTARQSNG